MEKDSKMEKTYTLTVNIEKAGTKYTYEDGESTKSLAGHMWYSISDGIETHDFGFASKNGRMIDEGEVVTNDRSAYAGDSAFSKTIEISEEQYSKLFEFGEKDDLSPFDETKYRLLTNSCIDYVYKALESADLNPTRFEGDVIPMNNRDEIIKLLNEEPLSQLDLSIDQLRAIEKLTSLEERLIENVEPNKNEKLSELYTQMNEVLNAGSNEKRLEKLENLEVFKNLENEFAKNLTSQYVEKLVANNGESLNPTQIANLDIAMNNTEDKKEKEYESFTSYSNNDSNSNTNTQALS